MSFNKYIQYKALDRIYSAQGDGMLEALLKEPAAQEKAEMKNVCAMITLGLFNELEEVCGLLEISKRKFIELALIQAIEQANAIIKDEGVFEAFEAMSPAKA